MSILRTLTEFLTKLDNLTWVSPDGDLVGSYTKELVSQNGEFDLSYRIETMTSVHDEDVPFRAVINLRYRKQSIFHWGCVSNEENAQFIKWWLAKHRVINDTTTKRERLDRKEGEQIWKQL